MAMEERLNSSFDSLKKEEEMRKFFFLDPWLHSNVHFESKLGWAHVIFLQQATYDFEA